LIKLYERIIHLRAFKGILTQFNKMNYWLNPKELHEFNYSLMDNFQLLLHKYHWEDLKDFSWTQKVKNQCRWLSMVVHTCNPATKDGNRRIVVQGQPRAKKLEIPYLNYKSFMMEHACNSSYGGGRAPRYGRLQSRANLGQKAQDPTWKINFSKKGWGCGSKGRMLT
jgi:hypothetical protein